MKAVILAGGFGTRLSEETAVLPKPLVEVGAEPILWHILKGYSNFGIDDFIVCCGYKGHLIKEYFQNYVLRHSSVTFDLKTGETKLHTPPKENWRVTLLDTGENSMTGGRLGRTRDLIGNETFCFTYGDGVGNIDIQDLIRFHKSHGKLATLTAVQPTGRFGTIMLSESDPTVNSFMEKPAGDGAWISGGFFVLEPAIFDYIEDDKSVWERGPLSRLAEEGQLMAYRHTGFWHPMDTLRDKVVLNEMWQSGKAPWKTWDAPGAPSA